MRLVYNTELPLMLRIERIADEAEDIKTLVFMHRLNSRPGQFIMLWLPRIDEKPFAVSYQDTDKFAITVKSVGEFSEAVHRLKPGDRVGIRGPYGKGFEFELYQHVLIVAGGYGAAPLSFLANQAMLQGKGVTFILGAKKASHLPYLNRLSQAHVKLITVTEDGSTGIRGLATEVLARILHNHDRTGSLSVYACGPEAMLKAVVDICRNLHVAAQLSLERYIKCGFGICGQCCVDELGIRICKEGPVVDLETAASITELGVYKRTPSGRRIAMGDKK